MTDHWAILLQVMSAPFNHYHLEIVDCHVLVYLNDQEQTRLRVVSNFGDRDRDRQN